MSAEKTAAILVIGDELLTGRTRDVNMHHLAGWLNARGVALREARFVGDDHDAIVSALNALRPRYDYVFTSGGIGPTHDDITAEAVAAAFGVPCVEHPEAIRLIEAWYGARGEDVTPARRRMARAPQGAELIPNPVSGAPGIRIGNVFVMAGVPRIFQGMLAAVERSIEGGARIHARAVTALRLPESRIADALREIQAQAEGVIIGSYPIEGDFKGVTIVARSADEAAAEKAAAAVARTMREMGFEPEMADHRQKSDDKAR
ncbi:competence/damage-inducible protein A [Amphiplicatus metriothermophilus]|uniref:Molybdenum cofactor synthesis domain-containing protein n=1 Tax=Amphiplicatus metriothermophilus TaxID=1519374 RepID=A0A239Q048_9PROT|nr:molybdopterin-binding protein [Amphiplicatus metriothermophilus]MBB5520038.1 molybdenum cofactor synthesis domain-containing protein [Amphiplicatus metriothermophilus]SNT75800.1 molybdenum cofactor synthesis domain-containing protein [Amphiplicatus metriothermophilus]